MGRRKGVPIEPETRAKMVAALRTPAIRQQIAESVRLVWQDPEYRAKRVSQRGQSLSPEHRAAIQRAKVGRKVSPATRAKISATLKGHKPFIYDTVKGEFCAYCLAPNPTTIDHVIPLSRGGLDTPDNRVPCCFIDNCSKGRRTPTEWLADGLRDWTDSPAYHRRKAREDA